MDALNNFVLVFIRYIVFRLFMNMERFKYSVLPFLTLLLLNFLFLLKFREVKQSELTNTSKPSFLTISNLIIF